MFPDLASDPAGNSQGLEGHQHNRALFACSPPSLRTQAAGTVDCKTCPCLHAVWWEWPVTYITLENSTHHRVTRQMQAWMWHATRRELPAPVETAKKRPLPHTGQDLHLGLYFCFANSFISTYDFSVIYSSRSLLQKLGIRLTSDIPGTNTSHFIHLQLFKYPFL